MPEAVVKITNKVLVVGKFKDLTATLKLPATDYLIERTLHELRVEGAGKHGRMRVEWLNNNHYSFCELEHESRDINHIYELNHLMGRVAALSDVERAKLGVLCGTYLDDDSRFFESCASEYEPTIAHAINLTHNLEGIQVIEGINDFRQLGHYCVDKSIPGFEGLRDIDPKYLDYDRIGRDYNERLGGDIYFAGCCYVYNLPQPETMVNPYDGKSLLIEPEPDREPEEAPGQTGRMTMGGM